MDLPSDLRDPESRENYKCLNRWLSQGHSSTGGAKAAVTGQCGVGQFSSASGQVSQRPQGTSQSGHPQV